MSEEKYSEIIHDALNFLDDEMIEEVDRLRGGASVERPKQTRYWKKWVALAASICLIVLLGNTWGFLQESAFDTESLNGSNQTGDDKVAGNMEDVNQSAENMIDEEIVNLQDYTVVYFSEVKNQIPSDDYMVMLSEESCEILDKFLDSMQRGTTTVVDEASQSEVKNKAQGQLVFELADGTRFHLILISDGMVCSAETPNVWIQMDERVYRMLMQSLKGGMYDEVE